MNTWKITKITGLHTLSGRGVLITFIPVENDIHFNNTHPFSVDDIVLYGDKKYLIIGIEKFPSQINRLTKEYGFLIKDL